MARSRYVITEPDKPHFLTCTVMEWLPVFSRPEAVGILLGSWRYQREQEGLRLYGYVVMENHIHFLAQAEKLDKRGYVDKGEDWRYSSARNYADKSGLLEIDRWW